MLVSACERERERERERKRARERDRERERDGEREIAGEGGRKGWRERRERQNVQHFCGVAPYHLHKR